MTMIIDCHGHYTVLPQAHDAWREEQKAAFKAGTECPPYPAISDDEIRETIEANQLRLIRERGADMTIFSPRASAMAPHVGDQSVAVKWAQVCNDLIGRVASLYPEVFAPVCMRLRTYALPLSKTARAYVDRVAATPAVAEWMAAARAEHDFIAEDEPYRTSGTPS